MLLLDHSSPRASPLLGLRVRAHRAQLDRLIAEGRSTSIDPRLDLRARQLAEPALRAALATALREALRSIDERASPRLPRPQAPVAAASVRLCTPELGELARALTDIKPRARGVAITRVLLTDGAGPLYRSGQADQLRNTVLAARAAL